MQAALAQRASTRFASLLRHRSLCVRVTAASQQEPSASPSPQQAAAARPAAQQPGAAAAAAASTPTRPARPPPPSGPPVMFGPDGTPLKVVVPEGGVTVLDRGENDYPTNWKRVATLVGGDIVGLLVFAAIGRNNHGEAISAETFSTAMPFIIGWLVSAPLLGGYGREATRGLVRPAAITAAKVWALATPLGLVFRGLSRGYVPPVPFVIVSLVATAVVMVGWRSAYAAIVSEEKVLTAREKSALRKDKKGNPFEFLQLLFSLTNRW